MADTYHVRISAKAAADLKRIFEYIRQDSPQNAADMARRLLGAMEGLDQLPHRHSVVSHRVPRGRQIRSMPVRPYLIRHRIDEKARAVDILSVRHGARRRP